MAIEKMYMINLVGAFSDFDKLTKLLALGGFMQPINALQEINASDFSLKTSEDNIEALMDVGYIRPYIYDKDYGASLKQIEDLINEEKSFNINGEQIKEVDFDFCNIENRLFEVYRSYDLLKRELEDLKEKNHYLENTYEALMFLKNVAIPIEDMCSMKNFKIALYKVKHENMTKLKANYENIPSILQSVYEEKDFVIFIAFTPLLLIVEAERIFKSANCEEILIPDHYIGTPREVVQIIVKEKTQVQCSIKSLEDKLRHFLEENYKTIKILKNSYELERKSSEIKKMTACTKEFFYLSGWIPKSYRIELEKVLDNFKERIVVISKKANEINNVNISPPTRLKNNKFIKPFQSMVGMYGTPNYNELDPTFFLTVTYTLMFGAMFGDVGQGLILFIAGLYLRNKLKRINLGGILQVLGISSTIFGFLYGSIFGFENVIDAVLIRPMEDINDILIGAIIFGCGFLIVGFILGIINSIKKKDLEHGVFGKEGLAGFMFYIGILTLVVGKLSGKELLPTSMWVVFLIFCLMLILLKQPLANSIIRKKPLFNDGAKDYFIEASFEVIETILSMFSNTVSFIRVGAFALNHVGLFVAFTAMAQMTDNGIASVFILILGNIIIIGLEGLIVFIQGLRLQYYELFSKYYDGGGVPFEPIEVKFN